MLPARRPQQPAEGKDGGQQQEADEKARQQQRRRRTGGKDGGAAAGAVQRRPAQQRRGAQSLGAVTALGTVALYASVRGGISLFHTLRRRQLRLLLTDLAEAFNELGLTYWLDFGSLLGIHRDGDLIPHDNDVDLAVLDPDWEVLLVQLRVALPQYSMRLVVPSDDPSTMFLRAYCPLGMADVFGASAVGDERLLVDCGHGSCTEISRAAVLPTAVTSWRGAKIAVPGDIEAALEERYGDWRIPKYMDKGADVVEGNKLYARIFRALGTLGIRI